jgi:hypothetical protein|tara:strand:- start:1725 stop:1916 length:192 start_codon:yes stop_codon:yes gene_type:complete
MSETETIHRECVICGEDLFIDIESESGMILSGGEYFGKMHDAEDKVVGEYWECRGCYEEDEIK